MHGLPNGAGRASLQEQALKQRMEPIRFIPAWPGLM